MWQYTTETIINSNKGKLKDGKRIVKDATQNKLLIEGVGAFDLDKIEKVWKRAYQPAKKAAGKLNIKTVTPGEVYRLQVWVSEEGTIRPELQNALMMKSLPFQFEVVAGKDVAELASALEKAVNKMFIKKGADKLFTVKVDPSTSASGAKTLNIEATDCYVRFDNVKLDKIADSVNLTGYQDYVAADAIPADKMGLDIGPKSAEMFAEAVKTAKTVVWNGPMGVFENPVLAKGTIEVAKALAETDATTIIGGGDSAAAVNQLGFADKMSHISTGGGASLEFLEGKTLPGVAAADNK